MRGLALPSLRSEALGQAPPESRGGDRSTTPAWRATRPIAGGILFSDLIPRGGGLFPEQYAVSLRIDALRMRECAGAIRYRVRDVVG